MKRRLVTILPTLKPKHIHVGKRKEKELAAKHKEKKNGNSRGEGRKLEVHSLVLSWWH